MPKLTISDLEKLRETARASIFLRNGGPFRAKITVHMGTCGLAAGARDIMDAFLRLLNEKQIADVILTTSGCAGMCSREPMATIELPGQAPVKYVDLTPEKVRVLFDSHVLGGKPVAEFALGLGSERTF
jgi:NADP-reducing hydrogenase subunit HndB